MSELTHGRWAYRNRGCRCDVCTEDHRVYVGERRDARRLGRVWVDGRRVHPDAEHGTDGGYINWACRCEPCTEAHTANRRRQRENERQRT